MHIAAASRSGVLVLLALLAAVSALAVTAPTDLLAEEEPGERPPAQDSDRNLVHGMRFFDDAVRYVARGRAATPHVRDFYAKFDLKNQHARREQEVYKRIWFQVPNLYRQDFTAHGVTTTTILDGEIAWVRTPNGHVLNLSCCDEGQRRVSEVQKGRRRISNLTQFLTLQTLKGPGVTFTFDGYKSGSGAYEGKWIRITRRAPGRTNIVFWLGYQRSGENDVRATFPGIVRVEGDARGEYPTEDYILKEWDSALSQQRRDFRFPRAIEGYSLLKDAQGRPAPTRFLVAVVEDIKINQGIDATRFRQPR